MSKKPNRNDPCPCGSGKKYKNCCIDKDNTGVSSKMGMIALVVVIIIGLVFVVASLSGDGNAQDCPPGTTWSEAHGHCH